MASCLPGREHIKTSHETLSLYLHFTRNHQSLVHPLPIFNSRAETYTFAISAVNLSKLVLRTIEG
jgi:hypothetical protein